MKTGKEWLRTAAKIILLLLISIIAALLSEVYHGRAQAVAAETGQSKYQGYKSIKIKSSGFKCYTHYKAITRKSSLQYKLQTEHAYTGDFGIRMVDGRFCVAVGTAVTTKMGQYIDVVLENGTVIPCIAADQKADQHTKADRITTASNGCVCEFYLGEVLPEIKACGDVSKACPEWESPVCEFRVLDKNIFEEEKSMTQREQIVDNLRKHGKITDLTAFDKYGIRRLGARIFDLRAAGFRIRSEDTKAKNRFGKITRFTTYIWEDKR